MRRGRKRVLPLLLVLLGLGGAAVPYGAAAVRSSHSSGKPAHAHGRTAPTHRHAPPRQTPRHTHKNHKTVSSSQTSAPSAALFQEATESRRQLQQTLQDRLKTLEARKAALAQAASRAQRNSGTLARLTARQKRLEQQISLLQTRRQAADTRRQTLSQNERTLEEAQKQLSLQNVALAPLASQLSALPELPVLASSDENATGGPPSSDSALLPSLIALRLRLNAAQEQKLASRTERVETQEEALARRTRELDAQRLQQERGHALGETQAQRAEAAARSAAQDMQAARERLAEAQKNAQALTDEIEALAKREEMARKRMEAESRRLARAHQAGRAKKMAREARNLSGAGLAPGNGRTPVRGTLQTVWRQPTEDGPSSGMTWRTASSAPVVSPCTGRLLYAGAFRSFGKMVILDCGRGTRFVLAGFGTVNAQSGAPVTQGATLGAMPNGPGALFVQLRRGARTINPAPYLR